jgi:hypothetical protein
MDASSPKPPRELVAAIAGLTYPSDSDEPWEAFVWAGSKAVATPRQALQQHVDIKRAIVAVPVDTFFGQLNEADNAQQYEQLHRTLQKLLGELSVFRVGDGEVSVDIIALGSLTDGSWAGIKTTSVET